MPINVNGKLRIKGATTGGNGGGGGTDFISVWDTTLGDENPSITLPLGGASSNYNFTVNWGDGNTDNVQGSGGLITGFYSHTYATGGVYTITITGTIEGWSFNYGLDSQKITSITNIGSLKLGNDGSYFAGCTNLTTVNGIFDLIGTTNFNSMFADCSSLTSVPNINSWNVSGITSMIYMFSGTLFNGNISSWDTSNVIGMGGMFAFATAFNGNISSWDISNVIEIGSMFEGATSFNQDISGWNTSAIINMSFMFYGTTVFNQPLNSWDVSSVTDMSNMFEGATSFNQPLNSWDVSSVTNMESMFEGATAFNQNISSWDTSAVTSMIGMFAGATSFLGRSSGIKITDYIFSDVSSVTNMGGMFQEATSFNGGIGGWDVSSVTDMSNMFSNATSFNGDINEWDISNVIYMSNFMYGKTPADFNPLIYDNILNSWSLLTLQPNVTLDMGSIEYTSAGATARQDIIDNYTWTITDGGEI